MLLVAVIVLMQTSVGILILAVFQTYLPDTLGAGLAYPGYAITCFSIAKLALHTPAGMTADRFGRYATLLGGIAATVPALLLMLTLRHPMAFLALAGLYGVGIAAVWPAIYALLADVNRPEQRGGALALVNAGYLVGLGSGALLGAFITDYVSAEAAILTCIGLNGAALILASRLHPGARPVASRLSFRRSLRLALPVLRSRSMLLLALLILLTATGTSMLGPVLRAYAIETLEVSFSTFILYMLGPVGIAALAFVPAGRLSDRFGRIRPLAGGLALCGGALFAMGTAGSAAPAAISAALALVGYAAIQPSWTAALMDAAPEQLRGTVLGAMTGLVGLSGAIGPTLGGTIGQRWGPSTTFQAAGILLFVAFALALALLARTRSRRGASVGGG